MKKLGIDEIAITKGKGNYCAVLTDIDQPKLIELVQSRTQEQIGQVMRGWGTEVLETIEEVSIDLWKGYKNLVK